MAAAMVPMRVVFASASVPRSPHGGNSIAPGDPAKAPLPTKGNVVTQVITPAMAARSGKAPRLQSFKQVEKTHELGVAEDPNDHVENPNLSKPVAFILLAAAAKLAFLLI